MLFAPHNRIVCAFYLVPILFSLLDSAYVSKAEADREVAASSIPNLRVQEHELLAGMLNTLGRAPVFVSHTKLDISAMYCHA
jgi:hypothetical protein